MENLLQDLRYGFRMLLKRPGFTAVAVLALALGIGANTAVFSVVNAVLLRPLPLKDPDRLVWIWGDSIQQPGNGRGSVSPPDFLDFREQNQVFERITAFQNAPFNLAGSGEPERVNGVRVSAEFFETVGVAPIHGRAFVSEEEQDGRGKVAVMGYGLWQRRFGGDPDLVGKTISLNGGSFTVVGIMPSGFQFPRDDVELWTPITFGIPPTSVRRFHFLRPIARLKPGVSREQAQAEINAITVRLEQQYPDSNTDYGARLVLLPEQIVGDMRLTLVLLTAAVAFVLLIACANVANLLLARAATRQKEIAIRSALGASRWRLVRQMLTESVGLALCGGLLGFMIAWWGVELLIKLGPSNIPRLREVTIDGPVFGFTLLVSCVTGILFGLVPALQASPSGLAEILKEGSRGSTGLRGRRVRGALVVSEIALALVLLIGAGLMLKSFLRLSQIEPGFQPVNVLTMQIGLTQTRYAEAPQRAAFFSQLLPRVAVLAGVQHAGAVSQLPMSGQNSDTSFSVEGRPPAAPGERLGANSRIASPDYFSALGIPLIEGRYFTDRDVKGSPNVIVISETFARQIFPDEQPLGKRLTIDAGQPWTGEIVGVVGAIRHSGLSVQPWREMYVAHAQNPVGGMNLVVRAAGDPATLASAIKSEVQTLDKDLPLYNVRTMESVVSDSVAQPRFRALLLGIFAAVALILAAVGIYGVMSYYVTQRTHEIGIRMALGAQRRDVMRLVVGQGLMLAMSGVAIGLAAAFAVTRLMSSLLYEVGATDPTTFAVISLLLGGVATLACYIPARRATRVDPIGALRYE
ncbi:MAG: ABC transporter permease [Acidobacteriota bacterium]